MREILHRDIDFRGSIGLHVIGHDAFAGYMQTIRNAFSDFHNAIEEIVATEDRAVARLTYTAPMTVNCSNMKRPAAGSNMPGLPCLRWQTERSPKSGFWGIAWR